MNLLNKDTIINNWLVILFSIIAFFYSFNSLIYITPHHDQTFHINWYQNLKFADHFITFEIFSDIKNIMYDEKGFIHELLKPGSNPVDYHAYLFQINSILTVYFFSIIFNFQPVELYIFVSILFCSLSLIVNYRILIVILKQTNIYKSTFLNNLIYQSVFCCLNISFYKFYFSPLGHHNIGYFFFSLTLLIYLNNFFINNKNYVYYIGAIVGFASFFQITVALLLLPFFSIVFLFRNLKFNWIDFFKYFLICLLIFFPYLYIIVNDFINSSSNFFTNLVGNGDIEISFFVEKILFWFKKLYTLSSPVIVIGFILSILACYKLKKYNSLYLIILIHFLINLLLSIFFISYLRNMYYVFNIIIILSIFGFIYILNLKNYLYKLIPIFLIVINLFYHLQIISDVKKLKEIDKIFYQIYFENTGEIKKQIEQVKSLKRKNFVFFSDLSKNYFKVYDYKFVENNFITKKPILNLSNHIDKKKQYSINSLKKFKKINQDFLLISITRDFSYPLSKIKKVKDNNLINENCKIKLPHIIEKKVFRDSVSGEYDMSLFLTNVNC